MTIIDPEGPVFLTKKLSSSLVKASIKSLVGYCKKATSICLSDWRTLESFLD